MKKHTKNLFVNLIGRRVEVISHSNNSFKGFSGIVLFESENMLEVKRDDGKIVKIPKDDIILKVFYNGEEKYKIFSYKDIKGSIIRRLGKI